MAELNKFDVKEYFKELKKVPVYTKKEVDNILEFYMSLLKILTDLGHKNLKLGSEKYLLEDQVNKRTFELKEKNEEYLAINEELKEKNDEYQSLYEEYLVQNEELQEQNEEFQAINEELEEEMEKRREVQDELQKQHEAYISIFDNHPDILYVVDPKTYEVLFVNKTFQKMLGENPIGKTCYEKFQGFDKPCDFCTNELLKKNNGKPYTWEYHNPLLKTDFYITDQLIKWPDGRKVRFEMAVDITKRKKRRKLI